MKIEEYPPLSVRDFFEGYAQLNGKPITVYDYQNDFFEVKDKEGNPAKHRIMVKARQIGMSTAIAMEALYKIIWYPNKTILFISISERASRELMDKVKGMLRTMTPFSFEGPDGVATNEIDKETKTQLVLKNSSRIISLPNNAKTIVGYMASDVYIDEYGLFENPGEIWQSILPTISRGGNITLISTPRGKIGEFYRIYDEGNQGRNDFAIFTVPYQRCTDPVYVEAIEKNRTIMTDLQFRQEYCCEFVDEGITMFPYEILLPCVNKEGIEPIHKIKTANPIYVGIDFGAVRDSTVIIIAEKVSDTEWIIRPPIKEFKGKKLTGNPELDEDLFKPQLKYIRTMIETIRPTRVFVDSTGYGIPLFNNLRGFFGGLIQGVNFTNPLKEKLIMNVRVLFENRQIEIPNHEALVDQLHGLEKKTTMGGSIKYQHSYGKHDDFVWALALALSPTSNKQANFRIIARNR